MLTIGEVRHRASRRNFLRIGGLTCGGLALPGLLPEPLRAGKATLPLKDRSVVFVFMQGGPSQIETFDPKMTAPAGVASTTGELATTIPGVTFGGTFPQLARLAHQTTIVRSFRSGDARHDIKPVVSPHSYGANLGSLYARVAGQNRPGSGMPTNAALYPRSVDASTMPAFKKFGDFEATGSLGSGYAPFAPSSGSDLQQNMQLQLPLDRLDDRRLLLTRLDQLKQTAAGDESLAGIDSLRRQAFDTILGSVAEAFDLSQEDPATVARYDTAPLVRPESISKKWNNHKRYADHAKSMGKLMLLARRLCERGCGCVTVTTNFVWDMHADPNNAGMEEGMRYMGLPFDHAIAAFLEDVESRGLSEKILLVCTGEMGRTPHVNHRGGRDHWGGLTPLLLSGSGLPPGAVIGQSTRKAAEPLTEPITIKHLVATVLHALLDVGELRVMRGIPNDVVHAATAVEPIAEFS
jgi:hypothetical protein